MKIFDSIINKNIDELAEWLDEHCDFDGALWWKWCDKNYCGECEPIESESTNVFGYPIGECAYCEINGNCRFFKEMEEIPNSKQIIKMWLESESENEASV